MDNKTAQKISEGINAMQQEYTTYPEDLSLHGKPDEYVIKAKRNGESAFCSNETIESVTDWLTRVLVDLKCGPWRTLEVVPPRQGDL